MCLPDKNVGLPVLTFSGTTLVPLLVSRLTPVSELRVLDGVILVKPKVPCDITTAKLLSQTILCLEGRPDIVLLYWMNLSYRTR